MLSGFGLKIVQIHIATLVTGHRDHRHPAHRSARRIGPVRRHWNQANVALRFAAMPMMRTDHHQPCILPLRTGIRLQRNGGKPGQFSQPGFELLEQRLVSLRLFGRSKRVEAPELRPGHRQHFRRRIQFHRAGSQGNHGMHERQVAGLKPVDVA